MKTFKALLISYLEVIFIFALLIGIKGGDGELFGSVKTSPAWIITGLALSSIFAIWVAVFTWKNYKECISRSVLWRNSKVSILASRFGYTWQRMALAFLAFGYSFALVCKWVIE